MIASGTSVLVVDDNWLVRLGLTNLLNDSSRISQVMDADTAAGAIAMARQYAPDLVIMDTQLPDASGIDACRQIRCENAMTHVMFLTTCQDQDVVIAAMLAGATGYVLKNNDADRLLTAVLTVAAGGSVLDAPVSELVFRWMRRAASAPARGSDRMTEHERKILPLLAQGKTNRQIAAELYLSEHTIKTYVSALLKKLQVGRRVEAAAYIARREQLNVN